MNNAPDQADALFNSKQDPIPRIRPDIDILPVEDNGEAYLYFHDVRGYITPDFALARSAGNILSLFDGRKSINDLRPHLGNGVTTDKLLEYVRFLDGNRVLHSPHFRQYAERYEQEYEASPIHQAVTAGTSYPADPEALEAHLGEAFAMHASGASPRAEAGTRALYAPHIDPRVGMKSYVQSFEPLRSLQPSRVVMLATSHYAGYYPDLYAETPFILSGKDFKMPAGTVRADRQTIRPLAAEADRLGVSMHDRAHRVEHSIELHLLFLQHIWDHDFRIVPFLVRGFDELLYKADGHLGQQLDRFTGYLAEQFGEDDDTLFLISGDLAHVGRKFGDDQPAAALHERVSDFDNRFMEAGQTGSAGAMLDLMKDDYDPYRICGFPPLYTFLKAFPDARGRRISYDRWDQTERESAVTFGSILY